MKKLVLIIILFLLPLFLCTSCDHSIDSLQRCELVGNTELMPPYYPPPLEIPTIKIWFDGQNKIYYNITFIFYTGRIIRIVLYQDNEEIDSWRPLKPVLDKFFTGYFEINPMTFFSAEFFLEVVQISNREQIDRSEGLQITSSFWITVIWAIIIIGVIISLIVIIRFIFRKYGFSITRKQEIIDHKIGRKRRKK